jgi:TetR/AcrR family transcriptional repressor of nem operon
MARPREFDEGEVLDAVLRTFWSRGYDGTSFDDLTRATGLGRASLYGAFGEKERLYERAITHYMERFEGLTALFTDAPSLKEGLRRMLERWLEIACPESGPRGCFLLFSAGLTQSDDDFARQLTAKSDRQLRKTLASALRRGQQRGELAAHQDPVILANLIAVIMQGLATSARVGKSRAELERAAAAAVAILE